MEYKTRLANQEDKAWLETLRRHVYNDLFHQTYGGWDEEKHLLQFESCWTEGNIHIVEINGDPIGMIQLCQTDKSVEIIEIQILPNYQSRGMGSKILNDFIELAKKNNQSVILKAGLQNTKAIKLYKKIGFEEIEKSKSHIHMQLS